jgi:BNR repeat-like domain
VNVRVLTRAFGLLAVAALLLGAPAGAGQAAGERLAWSQPAVISSGPDGWFPDVAADDRGRVHVVWQGSLPEVASENSPAAGSAGGELSIKDVSALYYARWDGKSWSRPRDIALIAPQGHALRSSLAVDLADRLHLIYKGLGRLTPESLGQEDLWHTVVPGDRGGELSAWQPPVRLTHGPQGYYSDLAVDSHGVLHVIWTESARGSWGIYYSRSTDGGATWSDRMPLEGSGFVWWYRPQLTIDRADRLHVVWELTDAKHLEDTRQTVYALSRDGGRTWTRTTFDGGLESPAGSTSSGGGPQQPVVGVDGAGTIVLVYRDPNTSQVVYRRSADGESWSGATALPGVRLGVVRPHDVYTTATDAAGHVHLVLVGYPPNSDVMSLMHTEWDGQSWSAASTIVSAPPFPEYPRLTVSEGNRLHLVWFDGDKVGIDRLPTGIRYSTALTSAPRVIRPLVTAPSLPRAAATPVAAPSLGDVTAPIRPVRSWAATSEVTQTWLTRAMARPSFPVVAALGAVAGLLVVVAAVHLASSDTRGG